MAFARNNYVIIVLGRSMFCKTFSSSLRLSNVLLQPFSVLSRGRGTAPFLSSKRLAPPNPCDFRDHSDTHHPQHRLYGSEDAQAVFRSTICVFPGIKTLLRCKMTSRSLNAAFPILSQLYRRPQMQSASYRLDTLPTIPRRSRKNGLVHYTIPNSLYFGLPGLESPRFFQFFKLIADS